MSIGQRSGWMLLALLTATALAVPSIAADRAPKSPATGENVEMFAAIKSGQIEVQLVPKDESEVTVLIKNKTSR
jgi:hypothetical protein